MRAPFRPSPDRQAGVMLLEALMGILIFTIGLIGLLGMQTAALRATADMKYRSEAALLAEELINQMWADDHFAIQANYQTGGAKYADWYNNRVAPVGTGLPGATMGPNQPTVVIGQGVAPNPTTVTITMHWQGPKETVAHTYVTVTTLPPI